MQLNGAFVPLDLSCIGSKLGFCHLNGAFATYLGVCKVHVYSLKNHIFGLFLFQNGLYIYQLFKIYNLCDDPSDPCSVIVSPKYLGLM